jgi:hypothetical protein
MKVFRNQLFLRFFWFGVALHLFNCAIDAPDLRPDRLPEDLSFNDMECLAEVLLEQVLGIDNALAEYDEHDTEGAGSQQEISPLHFFCQPLPWYALAWPVTGPEKIVYPLVINPFTSTCPDVPAPPPWA